MPKKVTIPANIKSPGTWSKGKRSASFTPNKRSSPVLAYKTSKLLRPNWRSTEPVWAGRLFVGFNVGHTPTYVMDDLVKLVKRVRRTQTGSPDSTFVYQKGVYTHSDGSGEVTEDGAQVILINLDEKVSPEQFEDQLVELASVIVQEMQQETVIVELQKSGVVQAVIGVTD